MKALKRILLVVLNTSIIFLVSTTAKADNSAIIKSKGAFSSEQYIFNTSDFAVIDKAFNEVYIESARAKGASDGAAAVTSPGIEYIYHQHTDASGNVITNNSHQAPSSGGCFTTYHNDPVYTTTRCGGSLVINSSPKMEWDANQGWHQVGQNVWAECSKCGAHYDQSAYYNSQGCTGSTTTLTGYRTYYTCSCGHTSGEIVGAKLDLNND